MKICKDPDLQSSDPFTASCSLNIFSTDRSHHMSPRETYLWISSVIWSEWVHTPPAPSLGLTVLHASPSRISPKQHGCRCRRTARAAGQQHKTIGVPCGIVYLHSSIDRWPVVYCRCCLVQLLIPLSWLSEISVEDVCACWWKQALVSVIWSSVDGKFSISPTGPINILQLGVIWHFLFQYDPWV